jgi:ribosomal protein S18 acetylase RimI-like enzyme
MTIRRLLPADAEQFQAVRLFGLQECPSAFASSYAEEVDTPLSAVAARLAHKPDGAIFGWFAGPILQGVVGVQREGMAKLAHKAFVWGMYVAVQARRTGVGQVLLQHAVEYARDELGVRQVNLGVNTQNHAALALYRRVGFEVYGTEREYLLVDGVLHDEYQMVCRLHDVS